MAKARSVVYVEELVYGVSVEAVEQTMHSVGELVVHLVPVECDDAEV